MPVGACCDCDGGSAAAADVGEAAAKRRSSVLGTLGAAEEEVGRVARAGEGEMVALAKRASSGLVGSADGEGAAAGRGVGEAALKSMSSEMDWPTGRVGAAGAGECAEAAAAAAALDRRLCRAKRQCSPRTSQGRKRGKDAQPHLLAQLDPLLLLRNPDAGRAVCAHESASAQDRTHQLALSLLRRAARGEVQATRGAERRTGIRALLVQDELAADLDLALRGEKLLDVFEAVAVQDEEAVVRGGRAASGRRSCGSACALAGLAAGHAHDAAGLDAPGKEEHGAFDARLDLFDEREGGGVRRGQRGRLLDRARLRARLAREWSTEERGLTQPSPLLSYRLAWLVEVTMRSMSGSWRCRFLRLSCWRISALALRAMVAAGAGGRSRVSRSEQAKAESC